MATTTVRPIERVGLVPRKLHVTGMTCASCAARIEKKLNKVPGVVATVNYATETAHVDAPAEVSLQDLIDVIEAAGYGAQLPAEGVVDEPAPLDREWLVCALLTAPILLVSMLPRLQFRGWQWVVFLLASVVVLWGGRPFYRAAVANARQRTSTMDTLVALGVLAAYLWSAFALLFTSAGDLGMRMTVSWIPLTDLSSHVHPELYFESASVVVTFVLLGRRLERRARRQSGSALRALLELTPQTARLRTSHGDVEVPTSTVKVGDLVIARPGERIATDGIVVEGASAVDASMLTGESTPIEVTVDAEVAGGTVVQDGLLLVRATRVGGDTALARITALVTAAQSGKAPVQRLADRVASVFVPVVLGVALASLLGWGLTSSWQHGFTAAVAVLVVACPCALGLATPTALLVGTGRGASLGILVRGPEVLESTRRVDTVVLDKTGTLTTGVMTVIHRLGDDEALALAASLESGSAHPIARAVITYSAAEVRAGIASRDAEAPALVRDADTHVAIRGDGVAGMVSGHAVRVGRPEWVGTSGPWSAKVDVWRRQGLTSIAVSVDGDVRAVLALGDDVRPTSRTAVAALRALGIEPIMITGDGAVVAQSIAAAVGIERVIADARPEDKVAEVRRLHESGRVVAVVGDGINDAAALAAADLGIAMGGGTDVAIEAADITLLRDDLRAAADGVRLSRATLRTIRQNLGWAFGYNIAAIPLAASGLLTPMLAGLAMAMSSVCVVGNSLRLRRFH